MISLHFFYRWTRDHGHYSRFLFHWARQTPGSDGKVTLYIYLIFFCEIWGCNFFVWTKKGYGKKLTEFSVSEPRSLTATSLNSSTARQCLKKRCACGVPCHRFLVEPPNRWKLKNTKYRPRHGWPCPRTPWLGMRSFSRTPMHSSRNDSWGTRTRWIPSLGFFQKFLPRF